MNASKIILVVTGLSLFVIGCRTSPYYRTGINELERGHYYDAVENLEKAARIHPENLEISIALERAKRALATVWVDEAIQFMAAGDLLSAREYIENAFMFYPAYPGIRRLIEETDTGIRASMFYDEGLRYEQEGMYSVAMQYYRDALRILPSHELAGEHMERLQHLINQQEKPDTVMVSFEFFHMPLQDVFRALADVAGLNILIDDTVQKERPVDVNLQNVDVVQAMNDIAATFGLLVIKLESNTRIVCADTPENRIRYSREDVRLFPMQYAEADRIRLLLEPIADTAVVLADERTNAVVVRTRPDQMQLVSELIHALDIRESEVVVEVEILEVTRSRMEDIGLDFGDSPVVRAALGGAVKPAGTGGALTLADLTSISDRQIFITVPSLYLRLIKKDSMTRVLAQPRLRILNRTPARLHIGEQVPIRVTSSLFRNTSEELTSYQYRDVGIVMKMTPRILSASELALDLVLAVSSVTHAGEDGQPTIGTREVETTLRLRHGEVEIIAGLIREDERKGTVRIPLLGDIPMLGRLFRSEGDMASQTDIVISLTPHILDRRLMTPSQTALWQGDSGLAYKRRITPASPGDSTTDRSRDEPSPAADSGPRTETPDALVPGTDKEPELPENLTPAVVSVVPELSTVIIGQTAGLRIDIDGATNVGSVPFYVYYDPTLLDIQDVREGPFMGSDGTPTAFMYSVDENRGRIVIGLSRIGSGDGISGSGTLVEITLRGRQPGTSPFTFGNESVLTPAAQRLPAVFNEGSVTVTSE